LEYLRQIDCGEIHFRSWYGPHGVVYEGDGTIFKLRKHEEAGFVEPRVTAKYAGHPNARHPIGVKVMLTPKGKAAIS
jgi:hypothetical protein